MSATTSFIGFKLHRGLYREDGSIRRSVWEIGLTIAIKDKFRSVDIYLPQSKRHTSFWNLIYSEKKWEEEKLHACKELHLEADGDFETKKLADSFESSLDMDLINEQWDQMLRVVASLRKKLTPAHVIIQRLAIPLQLIGYQKHLPIWEDWKKRSTSSIM